MLLGDKLLAAQACWLLHMLKTNHGYWTGWCGLIQVGLIVGHLVNGPN